MASKRQHKLFYGSSYDRGLEHVLKMFPEIKKKYPDAELHICYGWNLFDKAYNDNPQMMAWKKRQQEAMKHEGIVHHGRVGKEELKKIREECGVWIYPTHFTEINCITALECQRDGCVPCVLDVAALKETVQSGVKLSGDIYEEEVYQEYLKEIIDLMGDEKRWKEEQEKGKEFAKDYEWKKIAKDWEKHF